MTTMESFSKVTLGQILDLIDVNRESEEIIQLMDHNGEVEATAMVKSTIWEALENRTINSMQAIDNALQIWLDD